MKKISKYCVKDPSKIKSRFEPIKRKKFDEGSSQKLNIYGDWNPGFLVISEGEKDLFKMAVTKADETHKVKLLQRNLKFPNFFKDNENNNVFSDFIIATESKITEKITEGGKEIVLASGIYLDSTTTASKNFATAGIRGTTVFKMTNEDGCDIYKVLDGEVSVGNKLVKSNQQVTDCGGSVSDIEDAKLSTDQLLVHLSGESSKKFPNSPDAQLNFIESEINKVSEGNSKLKVENPSELEAIKNEFSNLGSSNPVEGNKSNFTLFAVIAVILFVFFYRKKD